MNVFAVNLVIMFLILTILCLYSIRQSHPYPQKILDSFHEPIVRFLSYIALYGLCVYNPLIGLFFGICVLLLHMDYINLYLK